MNTLLHNNHPFSSILNELISEGLPRLQSIAYTKTSPATNIKEDENAYIIQLAAPGLSKDRFSITVENRHLTVTSKKAESDETKEVIFKSREYDYSSFSRKYQLPKTANTEDIHAKYEDGILEIKIMKMKEAQKLTQQIEIK